MLERREATESKKIHLQSNPDIHLVTMKECEYRELLKRDPHLKKFHDEWDCTFMSSQKKRGKKRLGNSEILQAIREGKLFGVTVASVAVPSTWEDGGFQHPLSPREFYEQFPPIFQSTLVGYQDVGAFMQSVIRQNQVNDKVAALVRKHIRESREKAASLDFEALAAAVSKIRFTPPPPQRLLVSLMKTNRLVCCTDLLAWYDSHGMKIYIDHVLEYKPIACFLPFVEKVTLARQKGDDVTARSMKVLGNAAYGSLLLRKDRFSRISYVRGESATLKALRDPYTKRSTPLTNGVCEVERRPRSVPQDMPTVLGVRVLSGAKLIMLRFYFDFLQKYLR